MAYHTRAGAPIPPPNTVYIGGPADVAWNAFVIIGWGSLNLLWPMAVASWLLLRHRTPRSGDPLSGSAHAA